MSEKRQIDIANQYLKRPSQTGRVKHGSEVEAQSYGPSRGKMKSSLYQEFVIKSIYIRVY